MKKEKKPYISALIILASIGVVCMHCNNVLFEFTADRSWRIRLLFEIIFYFDVPVFFMISGANLLDYRKKYTTREYVKKRIEKVLIPFVFWFFVGMLLAIFIKNETITSLNDVINAFLSNKYNNAYWFFFAILGIYMSIPFISLIPENKKRKYYSFAALFIFLSYSVYPWLSSNFDIYMNNDALFPIGGIYVLYVLLGYLLDKNDLKPVFRILLYLSGIICAYIRYAFMCKYSFEVGSVQFYYCGWNLFTSVIYSVAVFVLIKNLCKNLSNHPVANKIVTIVSSSAFGIYLIHNYFCKYIPVFYNININSIKWTVFGTISIYIVSSILSLILKKIPIVKKIIP